MRLSAAALVLASISWEPVTVQGYAREGVPLLLIFSRVVPLMGILAWLLWRDAAAGWPALRTLPRVPTGALLWYAAVGTVAGIPSRLPALAAWKGFELFVVAYWAAHASLTAQRHRNYRLPLESTILPVAVLMAWTMVAAVLNPEAAFRSHIGGIPVWLQGWFPPFNPNSVGTNAAVALYFVARCRDLPMRPWVRRALLALLALAWLAALSRTAYVAVVAVGSVIFLAKTLRLRTAADALQVMVILLVASMTLLGLDAVADFVSRGESAEDLATLSGRTSYWEAAQAMFVKRPWFGGGLAVGSRYLYLDFPELFRHGAVNIHNSYLEMLLGAGLVGALPLMVLIVRELLHGAHSLVTRRQLPVTSVVIGFLTVRGLTSMAGGLYSFDMMNLAGALASVYAARRALAQQAPEHPTATHLPPSGAVVGPGRVAS